MYVPLLEDGKIGVGRGKSLSLYASVVRDVYNAPGIVIRIFSLDEMLNGTVKIRTAATEDFISFYCPAGTNVPAYAVLGSAPEFFSNRPVWSWGGYLGDEGLRIENGDDPNVVFDQNKFLGNVAAQTAGGTFPFIGNKTNFTAGATEERYVASGSPVIGNDMIIFCGDSDGDGLSDVYETTASLTDPNDGDTDDDGLGDGEELTAQDIDLDGDGNTQSVVTNPLNADTDGDGIQDGTELSRTAGLPDTNGAVFVPDADALTSTNPTLSDTDVGGISDGVEDSDANGKVDPVGCETDPNNAADDSVSCGDDVVQPCGADRLASTADDEVCDDGAENGQPNKCNITCTGITTAECGNGVFEPTGGEECDDGNTCSGDGNWCGAQGDTPAQGQPDCDARSAGTCEKNDATDDTTDGCANCAIVEPYICVETLQTIGDRSECSFGAPQL